jgi:hypothetical protein
MKTFFKLSASLMAAFGFVASAAHATTFDFSYAFSDNVTVVTGTLDGDLNGNFVDHVTNVTLFIDGVAAPSAVTAVQFDGSDFTSGPIVSFDVDQNNFFFGSDDPANLDFSLDSTYLFYISPPLDGSATLYYAPAGSAQDAPPSNGTWKLTAEHAANAPDGGATGLLLAAGLGLLAAAHRSFSRLSPRAVTG